MSKLALFFFIFSFSLCAEENKPHRVFLKAGKVLISLKDRSEVTLSKGIYAQVLELDPTRNDRYHVYDKEGKAVYLTNADGLVDIEEDVRLLPKVDAEKIYPPKSVFKAANEYALFDSQINMHFDNLGLSSLSEIYGDQIKNVISTRYEARLLYASGLPVHFGLGLNYQSAYWNNDIENLKISILSFGPHFQYNFHRNENFKLNAILGAEVAPIYQATTATYKDDYSAVLMDVGIESEWNTYLGLFSIGGHYRHHEIAMTKTSRPNLALTPKEFALNSFGVMLGYKIEWNL